MKPLHLPPNPVERFYRGGARIARFRGADRWEDRWPEDWVGSTTAVAGEEDRGRSRLRDGASLAEAMTADPEAFLGPDHAAGFGADPGLLVKLLDAGERLPVHLHPDRDFARSHLGSCHGKTEAWIVVEAKERAGVYLGWNEDVPADRLAQWQASHDVPSMLESMRWFPVRAGDTVFVPAGTPHAIGAGILLVELQEPTDLSVLLEWKGFTDDPAGVGDLGLGFSTALQAVDRRALSIDRLAALTAGRVSIGAPGREALFPKEADAFFRAERIRGGATLEASFCILVVVEGFGRLATEAGDAPLTRGDTVLVPHAAGASSVDGNVTVIRCLPPEQPPPCEDL